jgi:hypothetical protein
MSQRVLGLKYEDEERDNRMTGLAGLSRRPRVI